MRRARRRFGEALALAVLWGGAAAAQSPAVPPAPTAAPGQAPALPPGVAPQGVAPQGVTQGPPPAPAPAEASLSLRAVLTSEAKPLRGGLTWRIYEDRPEGGKPVVLARSEEAQPTFRLPPGSYLANVTYGFVSTSKRVTLNSGAASDQLTVNAGALRLSGAVGEAKIQPGQLAFAVFVPIGNNPEGRLVRDGVKAGEIVRLPEGTYHVVSTWGDSNAIQRADLKVENGRLTDATLNHRAATVTLKLVAAPGTEAFAGTAFSVLTPGGDTIREAIGAFPQVTLAEGEYQLIARHDGKVYTQDFKVESGVDRDIEAIAKDP
ncbi:hypothetical protein NS228_09290 [Methylobacterium indicum]|uniref:hypothetical protein n=1 Tax=Methylobacterium indicum TaxID=1775910 RepID=UPI0007341965|nr:hypothetical protein [Methylobacterium indicum]KTS37115.1 hypothetical protein NS229_08040 [Methylobacterium indicum]KTS40844.1 hypothetical protein NS228_09290 [Methylobacterium indicum]KTS46451.1 hypothetical protein NS230_22310 [Methylobacterium indicum]